MIKMIDINKQYKVNGVILNLILDLSSLYQKPFQSKKRDYLIGRLVQEFNHCDWEEL